MRNSAKFAVTAATALFISAPAWSFPIAGEGSAVVVGSTDPVIATYEGNSASFSNDLYLVLDGAGDPFEDGDTSNDLFIFNNQTSVIGSTVDLGSFDIGTELIFRLHVNNTGEDFYTGLASRNPDGKFHALVDESFGPTVSLVSFEDLLNLPEYPGGFNDLSFSFTNTIAVPPSTSVPEPVTLGLLGMGLAGIGMVRRRRA